MIAEEAFAIIDAYAVGDFKTVCLEVEFPVGRLTIFLILISPPALSAPARGGPNSLHAAQVRFPDA